MEARIFLYYVHVHVFYLKIMSQYWVCDITTISMGFPGGASGKEPAYQCRRHETQVWSLDWEDPLDKEMATHSSIPANPLW